MRRPLRSSILIIAIAASLSLMVTLSSLSVGVKSSSREALERVGADIYVVPDSLNPLLMDLQSFDQGWSIIRELENSSYPPSSIAPRLKDSIFYDTGIDGGIGEVYSFGVVPGQEDNFDQFVVERGEWFETTGDPLREMHLRTGKVDPGLVTGEILISKALADRIELDIGDAVLLSPSISGSSGMEFRVLGIFSDSLSHLSESILIHLGELQYLRGGLDRDTMTEILLSYPEGTDLDRIIEWSEGGSFPYRDVVDMHLKEDLLSELYKFTSIIDGFSAMVISVTFAVCLIFTSTVFMISAKESSKELSILRAIGFPKRKLFGFIMKESLLYYSVGSVIGVIFGLIMNILLNEILRGRFQGLPESFSPFSINALILAFAIISSLSLALISGLFPAISAARRSPMEALRGEI